MHFELGDVLQVTWDDRPIRVMMSDDVEVFYDAYFPEVGWNLARARTIVYYRIASSFLRSSAQLLRREALDDDEFARHRPDLPMRLLRDAGASWQEPLQPPSDFERDNQIDSGRIALIPFGAKGAPQRAVLLDAANKRSFSETELRSAAHALQTAVCPDVRGIGLYRSGLSSGIPSYYLWGAVDKAGHDSGSA